MLGCVGQGFIDRQGEIIGGVIVDETVDPAPECRPQGAHIMHAGRNGHVPLASSQPLHR
jgi:hypothetical protein